MFSIPSPRLLISNVSVWVLLSCMTCHAESKWSISTFAGTGAKGGAGDDGAATAAQLDNPFGIARGPDGALYICEYTGQRIRKVTPDGVIHTVAGTGKVGYTGDGGPALQATFHLPHEIRFDREGNYYIADMQNHAVRKVDGKTGVITTFAGTGKPGYSGDGGPARMAQLKQPHSIQIGPDGSVYICDIGNNVIRRVDPKTGNIETFAGTGKSGSTPDGAPLKGTPLKGPRSLDVDAQGNLWLVTREGNQVFMIDMKSRTYHLIAGNGQNGFTGNGGPAKLAALKGPKGVALDSQGNAWLTDTESHTIRMINAKTGLLEWVVGTGQRGDGPDGDPLKCQLARPHGIFVDTDGAIYIGDSENHRVRVLRQVP